MPVNPAWALASSQKFPADVQSLFFMIVCQLLRKPSCADFSVAKIIKYNSMGRSFRNFKTACDFMKFQPPVLTNKLINSLHIVFWRRSYRMPSPFPVCQVGMAGFKQITLVIDLCTAYNMLTIYTLKIFMNFGRIQTFGVQITYDSSDFLLWPSFKVGRHL